MIKKIISGGQTGADQGGLEAGKILGLETGGIAPIGYYTEDGYKPSLLRDFGLTESAHSGYYDRTEENVKNSDSTVIFGLTTSPGSKLTLNLCQRYSKPTLLLCDIEDLDDFTEDLLEWLKAHSIQVLNVAGNRESKNPGIQTKVRNFLVEALKEKK